METRPTFSGPDRRDTDRATTRNPRRIEPSDPEEPTRPASPPVLLIVFNRPALALRLLEATRAARPAQLFIAADGPRPGRDEDEANCRRTRELFADLDWDCEVERLYRDENLGLQSAVTTAIEWFFDNVESGIILEDDCIPAPDFFPFAGEMLDRYRDRSQIMHVSGLNMRPRVDFGPYGYFFASLGHIWGWATWRRAWRLYDFELSDWPAMRHEFGIRAPALRRVIRRKFASAHADRKSTWSRAWYYTTMRHGGLAVIPSVNLIENLGFGADATHTTARRHPLRGQDLGRLTFPLSHPPYSMSNPRYDRYLTRYHKGSYLRRVQDWLYLALDTVRNRAAR